MYLRFAIAFVVVTILAGTHWKAYVSGKQIVQTKMMAAVRKADEARYKLEAQMLDEKQKIEEDYANRKKKSDAIIRSTRNELDGLRNELRSYSERKDSKAITGTDADPRNTIIRECSEAAQSLAAVADQNGLKLSALQSYVTEVCLPR